MVFPNQTNHYGTLFGGHALRLMDQAAFISASRYCRSTVVTACSERVDFHTPVRQEELVELVARGDCRRKDLHDGGSRIVCRAVALGQTATVHAGPFRAGRARQSRPSYRCA